MKSLKHYLSVALLSARLSVQSCFEYPAAFIGWLISNPIQFLVAFATIRFVVMEFNDLAGWDYKQLAFLYGVSILSHGLSVIFFSRTWWMGYQIIHGELDRLRLRPMNSLFQFLLGELNIFGITDLIPGIILFIYGCIAVDFRWTLYNTLYRFRKDDITAAELMSDIGKQAKIKDIRLEEANIDDIIRIAYNSDS